MRNEAVLIGMIEDIFMKLDKTKFSSFKRVAVNEFVIKIAEKSYYWYEFKMKWQFDNEQLMKRLFLHIAFLLPVNNMF